MKQIDNERIRAALERRHNARHRRWQASVTFAVLCLGGALSFGGAFWIWAAALRGTLAVLGEVSAYAAQVYLFRHDNGPSPPLHR
jgi:hypothetical protein